MFANWFRRVTSSGAQKPQRRAAPPARPQLEALEDRLTPSHLGHEVLLPPAATHGADGIQVAQQTAPGVHNRAIFTFCD